MSRAGRSTWPVAAFGLFLLSGVAQPAAVQGDSLPERPSLPLDVVSEIGDRPAHGHLGERRSTYDGRVQITKNRNGVWFYTARPELFKRHLADERRASDGARLRIEPDRFHASAAGDAAPDHVALCDPYLSTGRPKNPYACRHNGRPADCYDVDVLQVVHVPKGGERVSEIWSTPVTVTVRNPKSRNAAVARVETRGAPVRSPIAGVPPRSGTVIFEPVVSGDGRLLILNSGDTLLYSVMPSGAAPCDARNWKRLSHLSKMHRDPRMARYGIARYPIRDTENRKLKPGKALRGAYPWIDREAKNLFFTQVGEVGLFFRDAEGKMRTRFEVLNRPRNRLLELGGATRFGLSFFGLWSQGKIVVPDSRVNNIDFLTGHHGYRPQVVLYDGSPEGESLERGPIVDINSPESQWNYSPQLRARSPRDVVWWLSTNAGMTGEVVFDDALEVGTLIYSPMNAAVHNKKRRWRDGFDYQGLEGYSGTPRIQNAAASQERWRIPAYGRLLGGRIEPVAAGGAVGKGLWLDGEDDRLEYDVPQQGGMAGETWTTTVWVDPRGTTRSRLLSFPDGSWVDLTASSVILGGSGVEASVALPSALQLRSGRWSHLAFESRPERTDLHVDGLELGSVEGAFLRPRPGSLSAGSPASGERQGLRGWLDELRVVSGAKDPELLCNYAHGTLRGLDPEDPDFSAAGAYPANSHAEISARLDQALYRSYERYRCERERDAAHTCLEEIQRPGGASPSCVGPALLFPEGPLYHDLPRPDSRANAFCSSCHIQGHGTPSLRSVTPLRAGPDGTSLSDDARRQPRQAPVRIHGYVPKALVGMPDSVDAPPEGLLLDPWLYPGARAAADPD